MIDIRVKRVYSAPTVDDGCRVLVDRIWPRGMTKARLQADLWLKQVAPSTELRKWFDHDPEKWEAFKQRYRAELDAQSEALDHLLEQAVNRRLTLLFAAQDMDCNQAVALRDYLLARSRQKGE